MRMNDNNCKKEKKISSLLKMVLRANLHHLELENIPHKLSPELISVNDNFRHTKMLNNKIKKFSSENST